LERIGQDEPEEEDERVTVLMVLQTECEVLLGRPEDHLPY
jgi:hypothetical protein